MTMTKYFELCKGGTIRLGAVGISQIKIMAKYLKLLSKIRVK